MEAAPHRDSYHLSFFWGFYSDFSDLEHPAACCITFKLHFYLFVLLVFSFAFLLFHFSQKNLQDLNCTWPGHELREDERIGGFQSGLHWKAVEGWVQKAVPRTGAGTTWILYPGHCLLFFMFETRVAALRRTCSHWQDVYNSNARQLIDKLSTKQAHKEEEAMLLFFLRLFLVCWTENLGGQTRLDPGWPRARLVSPGCWSLQNQLLCRSATDKGQELAETETDVHWYVLIDVLIDASIDVLICIDMYWHALICIEYWHVLICIDM